MASARSRHAPLRAAWSSDCRPAVPPTNHPAPCVRTDADFGFSVDVDEAAGCFLGAQPLSYFQPSEKHHTVSTSIVSIKSSPHTLGIKEECPVFASLGIAEHERT